MAEGSHAAGGNAAPGPDLEDEARGIQERAVRRGPGRGAREPAPFDVCGGWSSGLYFITKAGIRYFFNPIMAFYADVGVGAATINAGLVWKLKGGS